MDSSLPAFLGAFLCVAVLIGIPLALLVNAVILRAAVSISNRILGESTGTDAGKANDLPRDDLDDPVPHRRDLPVDDRVRGDHANAFDFQPRMRDSDDSHDEGYSQRAGVRRRSLSRGIPMPTLGGAMLTVFLAGLAVGAVGVPINVVFAGVAAGGGVPAPILDLTKSLILAPLSFLVSVAVLSSRLPTTFGRACLVQVFEYLIALAIFLVIGAVVLGVMFLGGMMG